ncbi:hypothetical protein CGMCC3_g17943 [Colletotrichum fructicola]|nr:uncharacterized protein CGMCC3_g17943 [Colletotrichum fructicola]KAE9565878.1 hypothetical protein CGMCC3_g17943 [Colletotrichum fructicola]
MDDGPALPSHFQALLKLDFPRVKHIHARLRSTATNYVQRKIFCICSPAVNLTHLNVGVDSGPTQDESDSNMKADSDGGGGIGDTPSPVRGIPTLQHANLMFAKNRQGEGLPSKAEEVEFMAEGLWEIFPEMESLTVPCVGTVVVGGGSRE